MGATSSTGKTYAEVAVQAVSLSPEVPRDNTQGEITSVTSWQVYEDLSAYEEEDSELDSGYRSRETTLGKARRKGQRKRKQGSTNPPVSPKLALPIPLASLVRAQAVVMHGVPTRYKPGQMRRWVEEGNEGVEVMGVRWLLKQHEPEKVASSLVVYTRSAEEVGRLRMRRKFFRTTRYDWNRLSRAEEERGKGNKEQHHSPGQLPPMRLAGCVREERGDALSVREVDGYMY
ncbi:hypothetical protein EV426DRAFT_699638 [Tirmania nivea]|nr:hypothetical protein EV426DRAFT_699638 [Tirmania nivea]